MIFGHLVPGEIYKIPKGSSSLTLWDKKFENKIVECPSGSILTFVSFTKVSDKGQYVDTCWIAGRYCGFIDIFHGSARANEIKNYIKLT